jgi:ferritin-like metal-binding protein YciE
MINNFSELFRSELPILRAVEEISLEENQRSAQEAQDPTLKQAFEQHTQVTKLQIEGLERLFQTLNLPLTMTQSSAAYGLAEDAATLLKQIAPPHLKDYHLACAALKLETLEILLYESLIKIGESRDLPDEALNILRENYKQEQDAAQQLRQVLSQLIA